MIAVYSSTVFTGFGTVLNVATIILGTAIGTLVGAKLSSKSQVLITDILGLVTFLGAASAISPLWSQDFISALPDGSPLLVILGALLIGGLIGHGLKLEDRLDAFGERLRSQFGASREGKFVEGFVSASLLFVIGPLAILGSISDGAGQGIEQLILKSSLDFFASIAFASSLGWGVAASAIPLFIYQGSWTLVGLLLGSVLDAYQIAAMTIVGGLMLAAIALRLLDIKKIAIGNLLPALAVAPILATLLHIF